MEDLPLTLVFAGAVVFLVVFLTSAAVTGHTDVRLPKAVRYGSDDRKVGRRALLIEVPLGIVLLGGGGLFLLLFLLHPNSTIQVRLVAVAALVASAGWLVYLARKVLGRR
jgi:hypothetical protein